MDIFKEQLLVVKPNTKTKLNKVILIVLGVVIAVLAMIFGGGLLGPLLVVAVIFGVSYLVKGMNLEYEYILTNDEVDVDKIMNKERRKRYFTFNLKEIELMAHVDDEVRKPEFDRAEKEIDISSGETGENTYFILFNHKNILTKLIMEPNEEMQKAMFTRSPSKIFLKR